MANASEIMATLISSTILQGNVLAEIDGAAEGQLDATIKIARSLLLEGLECPMPLLKTRLELKGMVNGEVLFVRSTDSGSMRDIPAYLNKSPHVLLAAHENERCFEFWIQRGEK